MQYNGFDEKELTEYDLFLMKKRNQANTSESNYKLANVNKSVNNTENSGTSYSDYLLAQLCRKENYGPVMREEEFIKSVNGACAVEKEGYGDPYFYESADVKPTVKKNKKTDFFNKIFGNVQFRKGGKILLAFYVIIVLVLASTLIVLNTTDIISNDVADAQESKVVAATESDTVDAMTVESDEEETNWFDRLCDALNK